MGESALGGEFGGQRPTEFGQAVAELAFPVPGRSAKARQWWWPCRPRVSTGVAPGRVHCGTGRLVGPQVAFPSASERQNQHGLRHLAWLAKDDATVGSALSEEWKRLLEGYAPEPFRHLGAAG